jgi:hypothetical protein
MTARNRRKANGVMGAVLLRSNASELFQIKTWDNVSQDDGTSKNG